MTRLSIIALVSAWLAAPWSGCEREPVEPPSAPPTERAPRPEPVEDVLFLPTTRRYG